MREKRFLYFRDLAHVVAPVQRWFSLNWKSLRLFYFEKIGVTRDGQTDRRTGATLNAAHYGGPHLLEVRRSSVTPPR